MTKDLDKKIIELMDLFDDEQVTTADQIKRPEKALEKQAIDDFMKRNPMAGGGMLVQPGFGGVRQGYKTAKRIESNIGKTDLGKYEVKYKNKQIGTFDKISDARKALSIAKENDPPIPRKDVKLKGQVSFRSIVEQVMDDLLEEGYDAFSTADINSKLPKKIKNQYSVTNKTILKAIKTNRKLDKFKDFKFVKGTGLNQVKPLTKNKQKILVESFPDIDFDFTTGRKYGIDKTSDPVRWKKIKDFIDMPSEGLFPYGITSKDGLWNSLYRSTISGDRWKLISKVPKNWRKDGAWRKSKFKDTLTGQTITYDNLEKYVDSQGGKGTYKNSLKSWENRKALTDTKIIFKGKEQSLGGVLNQQAIAKFGKEIPSGAKNVPFFGAFQIAHKQGVGNNFWDVEVAYRDANLKLNSLNKQLLSELKGVDNLNQRKKIIKNYSKQIKALPGGASFMFEGKELGKAPTLRSATEAAFKELGLSRTFEANKKLINNNLLNLAATVTDKCAVDLKADGGRIGYQLGSNDCLKIGKEALDKGLTNGFKNKQQVDLAGAILKGGAGLKSAFALRNIFGPAAIAATVAFEGGLIGYDMLTSGKTLKEAFGDNLLNYALGKDYQIDPQEELFKRFKGLGYDNQQLGSIKKSLDTMNTINTGANLAGSVKTQTEALDKLKKQPEPFMIPDDQMMADTAAQRAEQKLKDTKNQLAEFNRDLVKSGQADALSKYIESGDYAKGFDLFEQAQKAATVEQMQSPGPEFMGSVFPKFEERRTQTISENLPFGGVNPAFNIPGARDATFIPGKTVGGLYGLAEGGRAGYKLGKGVKIKPSKVRADAKSIIDENIKLMKQMKETEISSDLNQVIKQALDEDLFDKKDRIIDTLNVKAARERKNFPYNQQVQEEPSQLEFYDDITKSNFRTKTGPFFDRRKRAGGGILKQAGDSSGPPPESGPNPQGLQGLMKRGMKI